MMMTWLQISAGQGPVECAWAVLQTLERIRDEAVVLGFDFQTLEIEPGPEPGTAQSALISIGGGGIENFAASWSGTVQWVARSPFRPNHKRKNWFVAVDVLHPVEEDTDTRIRPADLHWETMRASGPGGQHVNRTESAVRVTHKPTGLQASAREERSQHRNRKLALARLILKFDQSRGIQASEAKDERWRKIHALTRGNPVRVFS